MGNLHVFLTANFGNILHFILAAKTYKPLRSRNAISFKLNVTDVTPPPTDTHTQMPNCGHLKQSANEPTVKGPITKGYLCSNLEN